MAKGVFYHKPDSEYDDQIEEFYHFPKQYLSRVEQAIGDHIIYYGPRGRSGRYYLATATVYGVWPDPNREGHFYAGVKNFLNFDDLVPYDFNGGFEKKLFLSDGRVNGGRAVQAVRIIEDEEFDAIVAVGLSKPDQWPDRVDEFEYDELGTGFAEDSHDFERPIVQQLLNRPFRDAKFRQHVRTAYDRRCAFTGLRLINGLGRPEVEAAHIRPVSYGGSDSIRNGIALSGTVHWMFDRGLLSLADDYSILRSRQLNHDVSHLLRPEMKALVPDDSSLRPHTSNLEWHRTNCFKG